jgi:hypothetical protein
MLKTDIDELQIGDWCFMSGPGIAPDVTVPYIAVRFLDGDNGFAILPISPVPNARTVHGQATWQWNGSKDAPSLTPSILHWGNGRKQPATWHGYLERGVLRKV